MARVRSVVLFVVACGLCEAAHGQEQARDEDELQGSPRASVASFMRAVARGSSSEAVSYLDVPESLTDRAPELARRLAAVVQQRVGTSYRHLSDAPDGDTDDGLAGRIETVGEVRDRAGVAQSIRLVRHAGEQPEWRFSRRTVASIDAMYEQLPGRWLLEKLPPVLLRPAVAGFAWWQVIVLPALVVLAVFVAALLARVTRKVGARMTRRTTRSWDDDLLETLGGPLTLLWFVLLLSMAKPFLNLPERMASTLTHGLRGLALVGIFWGIARGIEVTRIALASSPWTAARPGARALLPVITRVGKVVVMGFAAVALLAELGFPVASVIAGLGIGGLAFALAAQKTIENVFGAFSIGADQPFREGDFVKIEDFVGTVETIGLRSTRIRTLDRTIITLPNGRLADMRIESFSARERMRLATMIGLVYETTAEQMRAVLEGLERVLRAHPKIWPDAVIVRFSALGATSLDIEVMAWFETPDWGEFQLIRQEILLQFMEVVTNAGTAFAFPTQTIHVVQPREESTVADTNGSTTRVGRLERGREESPRASK